jgi:transcriptional regulator with XRE-family HTH domain
MKNLTDGQKVRRIRELFGFTQDEIAQKLQITPQAYSRIERGETSLDLDRLKLIAEKMGITTDDIMKFDERKFLISGNNNNSGEANDSAFQFNIIVNESSNQKAIEILEKIIEQQQEEIKELRQELKALKNNRS